VTAGDPFDGAAPREAAPIPGQPTRTPWYRRRAIVVGAAVAAIVAVAVVSDLPQKTTISERVAAEKAVLHAIDADVHPCAFAVAQTFSLYHDETAGGATPSQVARIPGLMRDDQDACSYTDGTIFDLSTITVPGTAAGRAVGEAVNTVTTWATSDALAAIEDIQALHSDPHDPRVLAKLQKEERLLATDRASAFGDVATASRVLGRPLPAPSLPRLPDPNRP
jgi:hypothetical protein